MKKLRFVNTVAAAFAALALSFAGSGCSAVSGDSSSSGSSQVIAQTGQGAVTVSVDAYDSSYRTALPASDALDLSSGYTFTLTAVASG